MSLRNYLASIEWVVRQFPEDSLTWESLACNSLVDPTMHGHYHTIRSRLFQDGWIPFDANVELHELLRESAEEFNKHKPLQRIILASFLRPIGMTIGIIKKPS